MGFSKQECWSGLPFPLQGIFPTQELNPGLPHCRQTLYCLSHQGSLNAGDLGSIPGLERSPGGGHGNPLQCTCLNNPHGQRSLVGYSPWGCKESDMTKQLITQYIGTDRLPSPCQLTSTVSLSTWFAGSCLEKYPWLISLLPPALQEMLWWEKKGRVGCQTGLQRLRLYWVFMTVTQEGPELTSSSRCGKHTAT